MEEKRLSSEEILMLIEGLDALLPATSLPGRPEPEAERWAAYAELRTRLKQSLGIGFYDSAGRWLEEQLFKEREATLENMLRAIFPALRDPAMTRSKLKALITENFKAMKWTQQYVDYRG